MFRTLVVVNFVASIAHVAHNMAYFSTYPEPDWITGPWTVDGLWLIFAALLLIGYRLHQRGRIGAAFISVVAACCSSLIVFGHYAYASPHDLSLAVNGLIFAEGIAAILLLGYYSRHYMRSRAPA